jgi:hypothetical protein
MRWGKTIPIILILALVFCGVSYAWQGESVLAGLKIEILKPLCTGSNINADFSEIKEIDIFLQPIIPVSYSVEEIFRCQNKAFKSA